MDSEFHHTEQRKYSEYGPMKSTKYLTVDQLYLFNAKIKLGGESKALAFRLREFHIRLTSEAKDLSEAPTVDPYMCSPFSWIGKG